MSDIENKWPIIKIFLCFIGSLNYTKSPFFPEFVSFSSNPPISCSVGHPTKELGLPKVNYYSLLEMATWISVAVFDYRVIIRGIIVNIRGVHAAVNITSLAAMSFMKVQKTHLETLNMGFGRTPCSRTGPIWHHVIYYIESISQMFMVFNNKKNKQIFESCLCQTKSRWFRHFIVISKQYF